MKESQETVICPVCGNPFPKKRRDLGYNYCVNCSTEEGKVCLIEGVPEGDGDDNISYSVNIMTPKEARKITTALSQIRKGSVDMEEDVENEEELKPVSPIETES